MQIKGVSHPVPTEYAKRIYFDKKNVFIGKKCLCRVSPGDKFLLYESHGAKAYTGWADIKSIGWVKSTQIWEKYGKHLMINRDEFKEYSKDNAEMNIIEFENFEKFENPVKPKRFVTVAGKYIYEDEFETIKNIKGN